MAANLKGRHFLKELDFTPAELGDLLDLAFTLKANKRAGVRGQALDGKNVALIFEKPSTRTRCAFTVACVDEGAHPEYLGKGDIQLGKKETVADTARVLGRMFDGIQFRGFSHATVEGLAKYAGVPVWNGLTDAWHPTQILADVMTVKEQFGTLRGHRPRLRRRRPQQRRQLPADRLRHDRHGRAHRRPESLFPETLARRGRAGHGREDRRQGDDHRRRRRRREGRHAIYTDVWASMGEEAKIAERIALLKPYKVTVQDDGEDRPPATPSSCTACPASTTSTPRCRARTRTSARSRTRSSRARRRASSTRPRTACTPSRP